jgi:hypothetical protein
MMPALYNAAVEAIERSASVLLASLGPALPMASKYLVLLKYS